MTNSEFEQFLMQKFPDLHPKSESGEVLPPECGTECPPGWQDLVDSALFAIDDSKRFGVDLPTITQIKEKFAHLVIYIDNGNHFAHGIISLAHIISYRTCEVTGKKGVIMRRGRCCKTLSPDLVVANSKYEGFEPV